MLNLNRLQLKSPHIMECQLHNISEQELVYDGRSDVEKIVNFIFPTYTCRICGYTRYICYGCKVHVFCSPSISSKIIHLQHHKFDIYIHGKSISTYVPLERTYFMLDEIIRRIPQILVLDPVALDVIRMKKAWEIFNIRSLCEDVDHNLLIVKAAHIDIYNDIVKYMMNNCECKCNLCGLNYESFPSVDVVLTHLKACDKSTWVTCEFWHTKSMADDEFQKHWKTS